MPIGYCALIWILQCHARIMVQYFSIIILLLYAAHGFCLQESPRSKSEFYISSFGQVEPQDFAFEKNVSKIFSKLLNVANNVRDKLPSVVLVNSQSWPWAIALPDNTIVLTTGAVELCYRGVTVETGDARLAMLLGHELAHLAQDDYWHRDVYLALAGEFQQEEDEVIQFIGKRSGLIQSEFWDDVVRDRELKADDRGASYAALAGFDLNLLFPEGEDSFFQFWIKNTLANQSDFYLTANQRTDYLKRKLKSLVDLPKLFQAGLALTSLGYFHEAENLYKSILTSLPSHEIYNNLGYVNLAKINSDADASVESDFWLPVQFDINPSTPILLRGDNEVTIVESHLEQAINNFQLAVSKKSNYLPGLLNLSAAYFYAGKYNKAAAVIEQAQELNLSAPEIKLMNFLILYKNLAGKVRINEYVIKQLVQLVDENPGFLMARYNLAQIYEIENKPKKAHYYWQSLSDKMDDVPKIHQKVISEKLNIKTPSHKSNLVQPLSKIVKAYFSGEEIEQAQLVLKTTAGLAMSTLLNTTVEYLFYNKKPLLGFVRMPDDKLKNLLENCCDKPLEIYKSSQGEIWNYGKEFCVFHSYSKNASRVFLSHEFIESLQ